VRVKKREFRPPLGREAIDMLEVACAGGNSSEVRRAVF